MTRAEHGSLTIEREFKAKPELVFDAWSSADAKAKWFVGPKSWEQTERSLDFRVGGVETIWAVSATK